MSEGITARGFNPSNNEMVDEIKAKANDLAETIKKMPHSRRRSIALTHLETCSMFAVKANFYDDEDERIGG